MRAYWFAAKAHEGQYRDSGDSFIFHPLGVAEILAEMELDSTTIAAGLLHDVIEDTQTALDDIKAAFGDEIALLVDGVTKLSRFPFMTREQQQAENLRKMFLAMAKDIRVVLIRLADRLHNMRTLRHLPTERQKRISRETLEIFAPLAHRLGMWRVKWELEDLAFRYLQPGDYYSLVEKVAEKRRQREGYIEEAKSILAKQLAEVGIHAEIQGRAKHLYSIYEKMTKRGRSFEEIYDLIAIRAVVDTVKECYEVLGIVHNLWKPIPGRFKDYIAMPKSNMYQSLHTTVIGPAGEPLEVQIRTWEMHRTAEYGIAAHWRYKEGQRQDSEFERKIAWLRQLLEWQRDMRDSQEFIETLKIDLFEDEVFVFTPKGDVKSLPAGSTPVDFAYDVHTDIGSRCIGAKVNGKIVPLDYRLQNGDIVEILTSKVANGPSQDWLAFVKTSKARNKIRQWIKEGHRQEIIPRGRELLEREAKKQGIDGHDVLKEERLLDVAKRFGFLSSDDLLAAVGYSKLSPQQVITKILPLLPVPKEPEVLQPVPQLPRKAVSKGQGVKVDGMDNVLVRLSKCCNPVPGDPIVGYITRGRGVSIHRADCPNARLLIAAPERRVPVEWDLGSAASYPVEIEIDALDQVGLLSNIMSAVAEVKTNVSSMSAKTTPDGMAFVNMVLDIEDVEHMNNVMNRISRVKGVLDVHRAERSIRIAN
ncbi:MAG TPA: bifunctional (p)ppGpp synthetase/guanosine-3',5'-bis(diphosphate) 3'-pyrophosphohydrolase [Firmicutes bacterium]|nr:bifunctional (p)ppGpp synthetase/guanosine-3',5'-bis(diphosphate) 3'-pyrophosphohydrolase [Bacillota bacterium]HHY97198.1 bifunctional (p)ppGpp synthetase/guanosine-3',5'-bis(diphosphate) 3'-pyrophosphohydrolase [Bacillota bacterium]